ncbi:MULTISPECIES: aminotransferase class I/II-fold pyridoxal phosphate-dependent enzyme [Sphingomonadaceae]|jgi:cystathionine beta-lyase|uniref:trans-sulfuration enzyme family protein n=1 Tax=Sphingomonadales TaxID=204457 RepID=UPI0008256CD1|nr:MULTISPECIES: aminotransferase class I/II-fold pyridoxal phosphate-dependent enzyme [Sphingomonadaceae]MBX9665723.1 PLP-dependent transferase [Novosphingobium sp.]
MNDETKCLKMVVPEDKFTSLSVPVHRASTIVFDNVAAYQARRSQLYDGYSYGLYGTPTSRALEKTLATIEGGDRAMVVSSGFAAITLVTLALSQSGNRVLFPDNVYETVRPFADILLYRYGVTPVYYDPLSGARIAELLDKDVSLVWLESPGSMTLEIQDIPAITAACREHGIPTAADNTYATPLRCKPLDLGVDISVCAVSKYISGHSDLVMGSIALRDEARFRLLKDHARMLGQGVSADEASLALRGLETLAVRLERIERTTLTLLDFVTDQPGVREVRHPALTHNPGHAEWLRDFSGSTGLLTLFLEPWTRPLLAKAIEAMDQFAIGASWGGTKSVVAVLDALPPRTVTQVSHDGPLVRFSIGLEHSDDLIESLTKGFAILAAAQPAPSITN